jgi:serine O-acetyltransferase
MTQSYPQLIALIKSDLYRYYGGLDWKAFWQVCLKQRGFVLSLFYRITRFCHLNGFKFRLALSIVMFRLLKEFYNTDFSYRCSVGSGLRITHLYGLTVGKGSILGKNINLSHNITLGSKLIQGVDYYPRLGNNILVSTGAVLLGNMTVGDGAVIAQIMLLLWEILEKLSAIRDLMII